MKQITSNDDYRVFLKRRSRWMLGMLAGGIFSLCIMFLAAPIWKITLSSSQATLYSSFGIAFITVSMVQLFKNRSLLRNEKRLHQVRIAFSDERNLQISSMAARWALTALLIAMYLVMLIGGLRYPVLFTALSYLICLFLIVYLVARYVISKNV